MPYWVKMDRPLLDTLVYTRPMMPKGARLMIQRTIWETASAVLARNSLVLSAPMLLHGQAEQAGPEQDADVVAVHDGG